MAEVELVSNLQPNAKWCSPYKVSSGILGTSTKLMPDKFVLSEKELGLLFDKLRSKFSTFNPSEIDFLYLVSFTDRSHFEHHDLKILHEVLNGSAKKTEKLSLTWTMKHQHDGIENSMLVTIRISNPINPFVMLQAALSKTPGDIENLEVEMSSVSISVQGATQDTSEEIFELVGRWVDACPTPQGITNINTIISNHRKKIKFMNFWVLPLLYSVACFSFLQEINFETASLNNVAPYMFLMICGFMYLRTVTSNVNNWITEWCRSSRLFSLFMLTGGDKNQQTAYAASSMNSTVKLVASVILSFAVNVAAGIFILNTFPSS